MKAGNDQFVGISLKADHVDEILDRKPSIGFFEVHTENYTNAGGPNHHFLSRIAEDYQLSFHGVGLSIGSEDGIDLAHLERIAATIARYNPFITSEHLSWSTYKGQYLADLLPVTYDQTTLNRMSEHIDLIQNRFGRSILIENPSQYVPAPKSDYSEAGFLNELVARTGCGLLLDVNNIVVSSHNLNLKSEDFLEELNLQHIGEIHLAGHATK